MAAAVASQNWMNPLFGRLSKVVELVSSNLRTTSSMTKPVSPFGDFGVLAAMGGKPASQQSRSLKQGAFFTVEEARDRLSALIDRKFVPSSINDLVSYLGERFLKLETRSSPNGRMANFLVDAKSSRAVPAAQVDHSLSRENVLALKLKAALKEQLGRDEHGRVADPRLAFSSWEAMKWDMENSGTKARYTVSDGKAWYGVQFAEATGEADKDREIVRNAKARGIDLVLPIAPGTTGPIASLVPGMPILVKAQSMEASKVDPRMSHDNLAAAFKENAKQMAEQQAREWTDATYGPTGLLERWMAKSNATASSPAGPFVANVVSMDRFKAQFARKQQSPDPVSADESFVFGGDLYGEGERRDFSVRSDPDSPSRLYVFDRDIGEEVAISVNALPEGKYPRETSDGRPDGHTQVLNGGGVRHYDIHGKMLTPFRQRLGQMEAAKDSDEDVNPAFMAR